MDSDQQMAPVRELFRVAGKPAEPRRVTMDEVRALLSSMTMEQLESFVVLVTDELFDRRRRDGLT